MEPKQITIYHSPDADDAFMFYGLANHKVGFPGYEFKHQLQDIETLNQRTVRGELDVTAVSVHAYSKLHDKYAILTCGASMGGSDYGPRLVVRKDTVKKPEELRSIAIPGDLTSAALALKIWLHEVGLTPKLVTIGFDEIQSAVNVGAVDGGVIIHEGQLTHAREGLINILDLGAWWWQKYQLPLPLGVNVIRKALGKEAMHAVATALRQSIDYSLAHREEALTYALTYGRGVTRAEADQFVGMYVNELTQDIGEAGKRSIELFLKRGNECGIVAPTPLEFAS
jgi:1,4-dihydroxy-6-naphthoate synthase